MLLVKPSAQFCLSNSTQTTHNKNRGHNCSQTSPDGRPLKRFNRKSAEWSIVLIYIDYVPKRPNNANVAKLLMVILEA